MTASRAIRVFGTEERGGETTLLSAGALEATLDTGNLRYIKLGGKELKVLSKDDLLAVVE